MRIIRVVCAVLLIVTTVAGSGCNSLREGWGSSRLPEQWEPDVSESPERN